MAYDPVTAKMIVFGGYHIGQPLDTWEFDGTDWAHPSPSVTPPIRRLHSMVFDSGRGRVVMFGGYSATLFSDTWEWSAGPPSIRRDPVGRAATRGSYTDLAVVADGIEPLSYQWLRDGVALSDSVNLRGSASNVVQIRAASVGEAGEYTCVVTDACGAFATSAPALISVCTADFDGDGHLGISDVFAFVNAWFAADPLADIDGNGEIEVADIFAFLNAWFAGCP
jgi:hypothetical protein